MCTQYEKITERHSGVSIPCKRESTCAQKPEEEEGVISFLVSIPCKRESTCAHYQKVMLIGRQSFHSLQTGKHMCTVAPKPKEVAKTVSIPCKRESTCAHETPPSGR